MYTRLLYVNFKIQIPTFSCIDKSFSIVAVDP